MTPIQSYQHHASQGWTRIDLVLALLRKTISHIEEAATCIADGQAARADTLLIEARLKVHGLVAGMNGEVTELTDNLFRLYEFVQFSLLEPDAANLAAATNVLRTLEEGYRGIQNEAESLEQTGAIPSAESSQTIQTVA